MTPGFHARLQKIFEAAIELTPSRRAPYLDEACSDDSELRARVEQLINAAETTVTISDPLDAAARADHVVGACTNLGKYELLSEIGAGAMGVVYRARDTVLDRVVALKVMRPEFQLNAEAVERFRREARTCAKLSHASIVTVYELGEAPGGAIHIAMELLDGVDWRSAMKTVHLTLRQKIGLIADVCDGLGHAHRHGIVHRDVKPSNLFLHLKRQAKILDFGIARMVTSSLTTAGMILGTPNYMAPEQVTGRKCDGRSDLFSLAIVSFEFLTGTHPFKAPNIPKRIVTGAPERLCDIDGELPEELESILCQALAKDPEERFQTGEMFASSLRALLKAGDLSQDKDSAAP